MTRNSTLFTCGIQNITTILAWFIWRGGKNTQKEIESERECQEDRSREINERWTRRKIYEWKLAPFSLTKLFSRWIEECCFFPCVCACRLLLVSVFFISLFYSNAIFGCFFSRVSCVAFADGVVVGKFFCVIFGGFKKYCGFFRHLVPFSFFRLLSFFRTKKEGIFVLRPPCASDYEGREQKTNWYVYKLE